MKKRILCGLLCLSILVSSLSGCGSRTETDGDKLRADDIFSIGGDVCSLEDIMVFVLAQKEKYESSYGREIWKVTLEDGDFESYVKEAVLNYTELLYLVSLTAAKNGITLSGAEQQQIDTAVNAYMNLFDSQSRRITGISKENVRNAYTKYLIAKIFYEKTTYNAAVEISEEEARAMRVKIVEISKELGLDKAREISSSVQQEKKPEDAASRYDGTEIREETLVRGKYGTSFDSLVFSLRQNQWSPLITTDQAYYLVYCVSSYDEEATATNRMRLEQEAYEKSFLDALGKYTQGKTVNFNTELWGSVSISGMEDVSLVDFYSLIP